MAAKRKVDRLASYWLLRDGGLDPVRAAEEAGYDRPDKQAQRNEQRGRPAPSQSRSGPGPDLPEDSTPEHVLRTIMLHGESDTAKATAAKFLSERGDSKGNDILRVWVSVGLAEHCPPGALHINVADPDLSYEVFSEYLDRAVMELLGAK